MAKKIATVDLKGKAYATVPARIKEFREQNPNGLIETKPDMREDGNIIFTARILKDKSNPSSGESTGHSIGKAGGEKAFEKLETIAVGRALALLGYMASGDIASSEEMEEFLNYKDEKKDDAIAALNSAKTIDELKEIFTGLGAMMAEKDIIKAKDAKKIELNNENAKGGKE